MTDTLDVNILVYASNEEAPEHERAAALVAHIAAGPTLTVLLWPVLMGYLRIATHPAIFPSPLSPTVAMANVESLLGPRHIRAAGERDGFWTAYRSAAGPVAPRGNLVPDAHIAALMGQHGVSRIWSRDRDLRKFDGITAVDPFADRYREGFG